MVTRRLALGILVSSLAMLCQAQTTYDALVKQGNAQLQAGNGSQALASGQQAIKLEPSRWEAYTLAGGALMNLKRYDDAIDDLTKAIDHAPEAKRPALRDLLKKCVLAGSGAAPAPGAPGVPPPATQAEIVLWKNIENSQQPGDFQVYLKQYPNGAYAVLAQKHLDDLQAAAVLKRQQAVAAAKVAEQKAAFATLGLGDPRFHHDSGKTYMMLSNAPNGPAEQGNSVTIDSYQGQPALGFQTTSFCRYALLYGQVSSCHEGVLWVTETSVTFVTTKDKVEYSAPRSETHIKNEGGREGDTFSLYDAKNTRYRFGSATYDSQFLIFFRLALSDFAKAEKSVLDVKASIDATTSAPPDAMAVVGPPSPGAGTGPALHPAPGATLAGTIASGPAKAPTQAELVLWKTIQSSTNPTDFEGYLQQYPNGAFAALAQEREQQAKISSAQTNAEHQADAARQAEYANNRLPVYCDSACGQDFGYMVITPEKLSFIGQRSTEIRKADVASITTTGGGMSIKILEIQFNLKNGTKSTFIPVTAAAVESRKLRTNTMLYPRVIAAQIMDVWGWQASKGDKFPLLPPAPGTTPAVTPSITGNQSQQNSPGPSVPAVQPSIPTAVPGPVAASPTTTGNNTPRSAAPRGPQPAPVGKAQPREAEKQEATYSVLHYVVGMGSPVREGGLRFTADGLEYVAKKDQGFRVPCSEVKDPQVASRNGKPLELTVSGKKYFFLSGDPVAGMVVATSEQLVALVKQHCDTTPAKSDAAPSPSGPQQLSTSPSGNAPVQSPADWTAAASSLVATLNAKSPPMAKYDRKNWTSSINRYVVQTDAVACQLSMKVVDVDVNDADFMIVRDVRVDFAAIDPQAIHVAENYVSFSGYGHPQKYQNDLRLDVIQSNAMHFSPTIGKITKNDPLTYPFNCDPFAYCSISSSHSSSGFFIMTGGLKIATAVADQVSHLAQVCSGGHPPDAPPPAGGTK